jgi:D-serine deaminase-like pyridoxal phosphate-dependent protein
MGTLSKFALDTPCLVLDIDILEQNIKLMKEHADSVGKKLRPHVKTHKCSNIAKLQMEAGAIGLCSAKVSEAEKLIHSGFTKVLVTSPVVTPEKIDNLMKCRKASQDLCVVVDNHDNAAALSQAAKDNGFELDVLIGIDPGLNRTGVSYENALALGRFVSALPGLALKGIQCYAGHLQHVTDYQERKQKSLSAMERAAEIFREFNSSGLSCSILTGTGTGTFDIDSQVKEMTDFQVGSYVVMDTEYTEIGSQKNVERFDIFKPSLTALSSVVSVNQEKFVTIDAGLKALYFTPHAPPCVVSPEGGNMTYEWFGDEHGRLRFSDSDAKPKLGDIIELTAPHCDPTINLYDRFYVTKNDEVIDEWEIDLRGCSR